jgi:hypothetical protein
MPLPSYPCAAIRAPRGAYNRTAMRRCLLALALLALTIGPAVASRAAAAEPDYGEWNRLLAAYCDPARGTDYRGLKARETAALGRLRQSFAKVEVAALDRKQQLAFWLNLYNVNVVAVVVDHYPVESIRDISTDPIVRLNVFKKPNVPFGGGTISLDAIENDKVREGFHDPRIHFALNCAAKSCPPLRTEAFAGARVDAQLDDQARRFLAGPGLRVERRGSEVTLHVSKIFDWFEKDFEAWGGGVLTFLRRHAPPEKAHAIPSTGDVEIEHDDYDWSLNDWRR